MRFRRSSRDHPFHDRTHAGQQIAALLAQLFIDVQASDLIVLGLARGGVPVAAEAADRLGCALDACVVRKIGAPDQPELAVGAIAPGDIRVLNRSLILDLGLSDAAVEQLSWSASQERTRIDEQIRSSAPLPRLRDRIVVLVDDGLATGASMQAAVAWAKASDPRQIVVAVPVAPPRLIDDFRRGGVDAISILAPETFGSVGQFYDDFAEVTTDTVRRLLAEHR
ncbi:MAG: Protein-L-isoaspartate O-methyltransferase [uncultured Thermomicrobiales bacterium]|uniref:Protein-L-isoaspartate O-methyltransferase n=1 Tax=uncultured Thermomicrobiales bacterium TaxID=1645740 RepID=A0A6J4V082_9BACT|nr:MAG: Protein-L-isoaspartate O-methyltransferase [uncultured Thermomicrobiales bacterium]